MDELKDRHFGEIGLIIGNGPSLKNVPLDFLKKYVTFGTNRIYLLYTPTYYIAIDDLIVKQFHGDIQKLNSTKFVRAGCGLNGYQLRSTDRIAFSYDPGKVINEGFTVSYVAMQIAYFMGFSTLLLVGFDHRYIFDGNPKETHVMDGQDPNHFSGDYFKDLEWHNPSLARMESFYRIAKMAFENGGRRIINLTENSALDVFSKDKLENWL